MRFGRFIFLALPLVAPAAYSLDHSPPPSQKVSASKDSKNSSPAGPAAKDADADARLNKMESRMVRRDQEMDKRMKSTRRNDYGARGRDR